MVISQDASLADIMEQLPKEFRAVKENAAVEKAICLLTELVSTDRAQLTTGEEKIIERLKKSR